MKKILISINVILFLSFITATLYAQTIDISVARTKASGTTVTIEGIITNGSEFGTIRYIQDNTAAIAVYDYNFSSVKRGDKVKLTGKITEYNNLIEITNVSSHTIISSNNNLPSPAELSFSTGFSENYEGQLVKFTNVTFSQTGTFAGNQNYDILQNSNSEKARINDNTNIVGSQIPTKAITLIGIMSQYKSTYQLLPRDLSDLGFMNSILTATEINTTDITINFKTQYSGSTILQYGITKNLELGEISDNSSVTDHTLKITGLQPATFYYVKALSINASSDTVISGIAYFSTASLSSGEIKVYFNNSVDNTYSQGENAVFLNRTFDDTLAAYINRAKETIDLAVYNLNNQGFSVNLSTALNNAANRGVRVRVIGGGSTANLGFNDFSTDINKIKSPQGINYKIMHNKFFVFDANSSNPDEAIVCTGSTNLTDGQIHSDPNNIIIINDQALAKAYVIEFEEMWGSSTSHPSSMKAKFGKFKSDNTPHFFNVGGKYIELYFSPSDNVNNKIIDAINTADASIYFATFAFTRKVIAYPIVDRFNDGVYVAGIFDDIGGYNKDAYDVLHDAIGSDIIEYTGNGIFHHKYAIIDHAITAQDIDPIIITGSHNWSSSANTSNDENTLIIHDGLTASVYFQEWAQRFKDEGGSVFVGMKENEKLVNEKTNLSSFIINNQLNVNINSESKNNSMILLYNINGKLIFSKNVNVDKGNNNFSFNLNKLTRSFYIIKFINSEVNISQKLIK